MSSYGEGAVPPEDVTDLSPIPNELETFARIEGLVGEEAALLEVPAERRKQAEHERLHAVSGELDQIWERLRERAEHLGRPGHPQKPASG